MFNRVVYCLIFSLIGPSASRALAAPCKMTAGDVRDLVHGAQQQRIVLSAADCKKQTPNSPESPNLQSIRNLRLNNTLISARPARKPQPDSIELVLGEIRVAASNVEQTFEVLDHTEQTIATVALHVGEIVLENSNVTYYDSEKNMRPSQASRKAPAAPKGSGLPIAVANPLLDYAEDVRSAVRVQRTDDTKSAERVRIIRATDEAVDDAKRLIINHVSIRAPATLTNVSGSQWAVSAVSPSRPKLDFEGTWQEDTQRTLIASSEISYWVQGESRGRIRANLSLVETSSNHALLTTQIDLADSAKTGTGQPLRIADMARIVCGGKGTNESDVVANGVTHGISGNEMARGRCFLFFDPCNQVALSEEKTPNKQVVDVIKGLAGTELPPKVTGRTAEIRTKYNLYGPQNMVVSVERNGVNGKWEKGFVVEPSTWSCEIWKDPNAERKKAKKGSDKQDVFFDDDGLPYVEGHKYRPAYYMGLKTPAGDQGNGEELYSIHVRTATRVPTVEYADDVQAPLMEGIELLSPEYQFDAKLRPSGLFGLPYSHGGRFDGYSVRIFVTIPIEGVSVRFPTSVPDLKSTSDNTSAQVMTLRAGALLTIEPWDYNRGANFVAIPLRFQVGGHLVDLGKGSFAPSFLVGMSATLPLIDSGPKFTQTSVGIGAFYELDGRDRSSHFLLSIGLNLLSIFSPPAGAAR